MERLADRAQLHDNSLKKKKKKKSKRVNWAILLHLYALHNYACRHSVSCTHCFRGDYRIFVKNIKKEKKKNQGELEGFIKNLCTVQTVYIIYNHEHSLHGKHFLVNNYWI